MSPPTLNINTNARTPSPPSDKSQDDSAPSVQTARTARFAEATAVISPIEPATTAMHFRPQPQPADRAASTGPAAAGNAVEIDDTDRRHLSPVPPTPLKSAMKSPGMAPRLDALRSPTFRDDPSVEKHQAKTDKAQGKDLRQKTRIRIAKLLLRGVNFACSLILVSLLGTILTIFYATRMIAPRNNLPPWAPDTPIWPQIMLLVIACLSLVACIVVFYAYCRGGHKRAEKLAVYYTTFSVIFFTFTLIMWGVGAALFNASKNGTDMWGWACKDNRRRELFEDDINYGLVCRMGDWALVCTIIEIVVEVFVIFIYAMVFYRYYTRRRLRKSMSVRDKARSDLYLAQLRAQSAPNTPGFPGSPASAYFQDLEKGDSEGQQFATVPSRSIVAPAPFALGAVPPPKRQMSHSTSPNGSRRTATTPVSIDAVAAAHSPVMYPPPMHAGGSPAPVVMMMPVTHSPPPRYNSPPHSVSPVHVGSSPAPERQMQVAPAAPGEQTYAAVPIPGAYGHAG